MDGVGMRMSIGGKFIETVQNVEITSMLYYSAKCTPLFIIN